MALSTYVMCVAVGVLLTYPTSATDVSDVITSSLEDVKEDLKEESWALYISETLLDEKVYVSRTRPGIETGLPLVINVSLYLTSISSVDESKMEFTIATYLIEKWVDGRLKYNGTRCVTLDHNEFDRVWTPDLYFLNLKSGQLHEVTEKNRQLVICPHGSIEYNQRLTLTLRCQMNLNRYPMDNQTCIISLCSYAYSRKKMVLQWDSEEGSVEIDEVVSLAEYDITNVTWTSTPVEFYKEPFDNLIGRIHIKRRLRTYLLTLYLPSTIVVFMSWVSFWIDPESVPARIALGVLTILTITTQSAAQMRNTPHSSATKAIDVWMTSCLVFVFFAFIEYATVNTLARRARVAKAKKAAMPSDGKSRDTEKQSDVPVGCLAAFKAKVASNKASAVEMIARVVFAIGFIIFNIVYWPAYLVD